MSKQSSKADKLLGTITQTPIPQAQAKEQSSEQSESTSRPKTIGNKSRRTSQIYFRPEDKRLIRELSAWFASQGVVINDSLVIRAALRAVDNQKLMNAYREAMQLDQRFKTPLEERV